MKRHRVSDRTTPARYVLYGVTASALTFFLGTLVAPHLAARGNGWGVLLRTFYQPICHQLAERSLAIADGTQAVCARCSGIYLGGVIGLAAGTLWLAAADRRPRPRWLVAAMLPTLVDWLLPRIGLPGLPNVERLLLAVPVGLVAALLLASAIAEIVHSRPRPAATFVPQPSGRSGGNRWISPRYSNRP